MPPEQRVAVENNRRFMAIIFFGVLSVALDIALVAAALPAIRAAFGMDTRLASWILSGFVLSTLGGMPLMARLSDLYGRGRIFRLNLLLFGTGIVVVLLAPNSGIFIAGRVVQGLGAAGVFPVASAAIGDRVAPERRGRMLGLLGSVYGLAFIIGPVLGGVLVAYGWWWPFVVNLVLCLGVVVASRGRLGGAVAAKTGRLDVGGIVLLSMGATVFALGINRIDTTQPLQTLLSLAIWPLLLVSLIAAAAFFYLERRIDHPVLRPSLLYRPQILLVCLFSLGAGVVEATFVFMADFAVESFAVSHRAASFMLLPLVGAVAVGSPIAGRILDLSGSRAIILAGTTAVAGGMALIGWGGASLPVFYGASIAVGFGLACLLGSALSYVLLAEAEAGQRAMTQGLGTLFISLGQLTGAAAIGAIVASSAQSVVGYRYAFQGIAILAAVQVVLAFALKSRSRETRSSFRTG